MPGFHYNTPDGVSFHCDANTEGKPTMYATKNGQTIEVFTVRPNDGAGQPPMNDVGVMDAFGFTHDAVGRLTNVG